MKSYLRFIKDHKFIDHRAVWTVNLLHIMQLTTELYDSAG